MARFKFRLERLLRLRNQLERQQELLLQATNSKVQSCRRYKTVTKHAATRFSKAFSEEAIPQAFGKLLSLAEERLERSRQRLNILETERLQALSKLIEARTAHQVLKQLRAKALERFEEAEAKAEQVELDEIALQQRRRKLKGQS